MELMSQSTIPYFQCSKCKELFKSEDSLKRHLITHTVVSVTRKKKGKCTLCDKQFNNESYFASHMKRYHSAALFVENENNFADLVAAAVIDTPSLKVENLIIESEDHHNYASRPVANFECPKCKKQFVMKYSLKRHLRNVCEAEEKASFPCNLCDLTFKCEDYLRNHVKKKHIEKDGYNTEILSNYVLRKTFCKCIEEGCNDISFPSLKAYRNHLTEVHLKSINKTTHQFSSLEEFSNWKDYIEAEIGIKYTKKQQSRKVGKKMKSVFYCRRSGIYKKRGDGKRRLKKQGSCKIGNYCTSAIELCVYDGIFDVTFYEDHYGHALDEENLKHIPLPMSTKKFVADKLSQNVPRKDILQMVRSWSSKDRSSLIKNQDLVNIEVEFNLQSQNSSYPQNNDIDDVHDLNHTNDENLTVIHIFDGAEDSRLNEPFFSEKREMKNLSEKAQASLAQLSGSLNEHSKHSIEHFKKILNLIEKAVALDQKGPLIKKIKKNEFTGDETKYIA